MQLQKKLVYECNYSWHWLWEDETEIISDDDDRVIENYFTSLKRYVELTNRKQQWRRPAYQLFKSLRQPTILSW